MIHSFKYFVAVTKYPYNNVHFCENNIRSQPLVSLRYSLFCDITSVLKLRVYRYGNDATTIGFPGYDKNLIDVLLRCISLICI
jgi:hypothetical protein